jgi:hypothetical protein
LFAQGLYDKLQLLVICPELSRKNAANAFREAGQLFAGKYAARAIAKSFDHYGWLAGINQRHNARLREIARRLPQYVKTCLVSVL